MKKNLLILIMLSVVLYSCGNSFGGFDPRAYNKRPSPDVDIPDEDEIEPPPVPDGNDPFKEPGNMNPDEIFDDDKFNLWNFRITVINNSNVPYYIFDTDKSSWVQGNVPKEEYFYNGANIKAQGYTVKSMNYYMYKSKNPIFKPDSSYNTGHHGDRMERFYFYRFTGSAPVGPALDNYVIAVDTYKKLVFAYAVPIKYQSIVGNQVPVAWGSVDSHTKHDGGTRPFYEYDPVGYVTAEGKVTIYPWFIGLLGNGKYDPIINEEYTANASSLGAGKSPYFVTYEAGERDPFREAFRNKTYSLRYTDNNYGVDTLTLHSYEFSYDGNGLVHKTEEWFNGTSTTVITFGTYEKVDANTAKYGDITFKVDGNKLLKDGKHIGTLNYNQDPIFLDRVKGANFGNGSSWKFTEDGIYVVMDGKTYKYEKSRDGRTALYGKSTIGVWMFYSVKLSDDSGKKDHKIEMGVTGGGKAAPVWDPIMGYAGYRITAPPPPAEDLFLKEVANNTYSLRIDGSTEILHKYIFSSNGKEVIYYKNTWNGHGDIKESTYKNYTEIDDTSGSYGRTVFRVEGNKLFKGAEHVGTLGYNKDPEFKDIQKGKVYVVRDARANKTEILYKYTFSPNGETVTYTTQKWLENESAPITIFNGYVGDKPEKATYGGAIFDVREKNKLYKDDIYVGTLSSDYHEEPDFFDRVKGATYGNGADWKFTENGRQVVINGYTYNYEKSNSKTKVLYNYSKKVWGVTYWYFYVIELTDGDKKIRRANASCDKGVPLWDPIKWADEAQRQ